MVNIFSLPVKGYLNRVSDWKEWLFQYERNAYATFKTVYKAVKLYSNLRNSNLNKPNFDKFLQVGNSNDNDNSGNKAGKVSNNEKEEVVPGGDPVSYKSDIENVFYNGFPNV
ncbi:hypothetical protein GGTG_05705 [Gaeumannomyces tritici R3-111a-1]|uniref:Uncharacterized protein n=1 Tax=Gaeumannomyces tritici (strain R3-111a-1) TaxID=644352 RepID=J3NWP3_GAET3|nr:hypothetical protein GGTG_05705 [Gaeumannomyces tritici R3-111a-1]EJT75775.1 hypothetical protein GGTG_05705 [Gaeumannomyces tritici R3-111a-1]